MPYPAGHSEKMRQKIVHGAQRLFNQRGFENVSINEIMGAAGLTRGGFYSYFTSKTELYAETLAFVLARVPKENAEDANARLKPKRSANGIIQESFVMPAPFASNHAPRGRGCISCIRYHSE